MFVSSKKGGKSFTPVTSPSSPFCLGLQKPTWRRLSAWLGPRWTAHTTGLPDCFSGMLLTALPLGSQVNDAYTHPSSLSRTTSMCEKPVSKEKKDRGKKSAIIRIYPSFVTRLSCKQTPASTWKAIALRTLARALVTISCFTVHWVLSAHSPSPHPPTGPLDGFFLTFVTKEFDRAMW